MCFLVRRTPIDMKCNVNSPTYNFSSNTTKIQENTTVVWIIHVLLDRHVTYQPPVLFTIALDVLVCIYVIKVNANAFLLIHCQFLLIYKFLLLCLYTTCNFDLFFLANACYGQPCQNGGLCSIESSAKGYNCTCQLRYDPATDCRTRMEYC